MSVNSKMTAIADAIRAKTGGTGLLTLDDMAQDIAAIDTSKPEQTKTATPSLSQQTISPDSGKVLSEVTVEPITSILLTSLDADFKAENIAEGVDMFGLIGTLAASAGMQVAKGNITASTEFDANTKEISCAVSVTGLAFEPKVVFLRSTEDFDSVISDPSSVFVGAIESVPDTDEYWISHFLASNINGNRYGDITTVNFFRGNVLTFTVSGYTTPAWFSFTDKGFSISISGSLDNIDYLNNVYSWYAFG